ncbi:hypothetical protein BKA65DRAFT_102242 [Rhexocercosporidium sp. MPI-PUGE-AT-0058]|nr:hypothetical protein BKA65DRAFT_102242 [Rhexocercosporidium sp. MPI-PUGE-AT-0058]
MDFPSSDQDHACNSIWNARVDVVAIHGLNGHALNTWADDKTIWFRDLLPDLVPGVSLRVSTYGYSSELISSGSKGQMLDFVLGLLSALETLRTSTNTEDVRIFFICHSLGGILFKKCLLMANERSNLYGSIASSICGVAFFGTPHRGSGGANLSKICLDIARVVYPDVRSDLVANLKRTAEELANIGCSVPSLLQRLSIVTAYETRPLKLFRPAGRIVGRESALLNLTNEMAIPIDADHRDMCRFSDPEDPRFRPVILAIAEAIKKNAVAKSSNTIYQACLNVLYFDEFQQRRLLLPGSYEGTFEWIWKNDSFVEWSSGGSKMLWIQGKPASGKSTMMKFIHQGLTRSSHASKPNDIIVDFFYSVRGSNVEQEHVWMLRSILWQIISQCPSSLPESLLMLSYKPQATASPQNTSDEQQRMAKWFSEWLSVESLQSLLLSICRSEVLSPITIYVLVDAMDESELLNRRKIAMSLLELTTARPDDLKSSIIFKVLVASRPDPMTEVVSDRCIRMNFESQTDEDIRLYVENSLTSLAEQLPSLQHGDWSLIKQTLQDKCQGVFLWVKLILLELEEKYHKEGCTIQEMEDILISIPPGLDSLYARMFLAIESQTNTQRRETEAILAWTIDRPVSHDVMNDIIAIAACSNCEITESTLTKNRLGTYAGIEKRVSSRCVNFLEWKTLYVSLRFCQFIHTTALQFITAKLSNAERLVEEQAMKYARFVVGFDPTWLSLIESWPNFQTEQLKRTNLSSAIHLFGHLKVPLFQHIFDDISRRKWWKEDELVLRHDALGHTMRSISQSWRLYITLSLSAAVQANHILFRVLGNYKFINSLRSYCFEAFIDPSHRLYASFRARRVVQWFDMDECNDISTAFERRSLFCDLFGILAMFTGAERLDDLASTAKDVACLIPRPSAKPSLFWFLSAARQGNVALARLYFKEWKEIEGMDSRRRTEERTTITYYLGGRISSSRPQDNIISIALDFDQIPFAIMMFEEDYVSEMKYIDEPDEHGRTALDRACKKNLVDIAKGIYPRYADPGLDDIGIERLREQAINNGFMEIAALFEAGRHDLLVEVSENDAEDAKDDSNEDMYRAKNDNDG